MKTLYIVLGSISLALGILGIFLPLLPTTPFLLLTAALYFKGSPRLYNWLLNHRHFGPYIRNFRENKAMPQCYKVEVQESEGNIVIYEKDSGSTEGQE